MIKTRFTDDISSIHLTYFMFFLPMWVAGKNKFHRTDRSVSDYVYVHNIFHLRLNVRKWVINYVMTTIEGKLNELTTFYSFNKEDSGKTGSKRLQFDFLYTLLLNIHNNSRTNNCVGYFQHFINYAFANKIE